MIIEDIIGNGFSQIVGIPEVEAAIFLGFFYGFVMLQGSRLDHKVAIMIPATILAMIWMPVLGILLGIILGFAIWLGFKKINLG